MQRRSFLKNMAAVAAVAVVVPKVGMAAGSKAKGANDIGLKSAIDAITNGRQVVNSSKVQLKAPEIAENGAVVPIKVEVKSPMTSSDHVKAIHVIATKNGNARCISVNLTPANGKAVFGTRIKLSGTQDVLAIAQMSDGTFISASQNVKVTIGGCG